MKLYYITGVSRGLGRALSRALADDDARVIGFGRSRGDFEGEFHSCDFTKPQLAASIFDACLADVANLGASQITFISNAGKLGPIDFAQNLDAYDIEQTIAANLSGSAVAVSRFLKRTAALAVPKLFAQISSSAALPDRVKGSWSLYCASKAGQEQLIRSIAREQKHAANPCVLININPGVMETSMQEQIRQTPPETFPEVERFIKLKEEGKVPSPDQVAHKIKSLIADIASLENGTTYSVAE